jgi:hypothetical protein
VLRKKVIHPARQGEGEMCADKFFDFWPATPCESPAGTQHGSTMKYMRRHEAAKAGWNPIGLPAWLSKEKCVREIQPKLKGLTLCVLASTLGISIPYPVSVCNGKRVPYPRHWE